MVTRTFNVSMRAELADAKALRDLIKSFNVQVHLTHDTTDQKLWYTIAPEVCFETLKKMKSKILQFSKTHSYRHLCISTESNHYWFGEAPKKHLGAFLKDPKNVIFPPIPTLDDGCIKCLCNSIELADSAEAILEAGKPIHHAVVFLVTSFEELGKACLLQSAGKKALAEGCKVAMVGGFMTHGPKMKALAKELLGEKRKIDEYTIERKGGAWSDIMAIVMRFDNELPKELANEEWVDAIRDLEDFQSLRRENALYVNYSGASRRWRYPSTHLQKTTVQSLLKILKLCSNKMLEELQTKKIDRSRNLADLFKWRA